MLPWEGPTWRENSLTTCHEWVEKLLKERNIAVWILHSWTKIWACPGTYSTIIIIVMPIFLCYKRIVFNRVSEICVLIPKKLNFPNLEYLQRDEGR